MPRMNLISQLYAYLKEPSYQWKPLSNERFFLWLPVFFALGCGLYFSLQSEPRLTLSFSLFLVALICAFQVYGLLLKRVLLVFSVVCFGLFWAHIRTMAVDGDVLNRSIKEINISGTVISSEARLKGSQTVIDIHRVHSIRNQSPNRLLLYGKQQHAYQLQAGCFATLNARLMPLSEPVLPDGYDPRLDQHFKKIGGRGFIRDISRVECRDKSSWSAKLQNIRFAIADRLYSRMSKDAGGIGAALLTGLRGRIPTNQRDVLRTSGLAHMLAISGMHMALITGTIYGGLRLFLAFFPGFVQRVNARAICGGAGMVGGTAYLLLSGMSVSTQRAYVMMALIFLAIIIGRQALTLRNVAMAAFIVLLISPHAILQAGFQMSFAAVLSLVAFYETYGRDSWFPLYHKRLSFWAHRWRQMSFYFLALIFTSLIAGAVTGYIGAYHFNYLSTYGLAANLLAVPILGAIIMPAGLFAVLLMPFGLEQLPLDIMSKGIEWVVAAADWTMQPEGSVIYISSTPSFGLISFSVGLLVLCLLPDKRRWVGLAPILMSFVVLGQATPPRLLVHGFLHHIALQQADGHYQILSRSRHNYVPSRWLVANGQTGGVRTVQTLCDADLCFLKNEAIKVARVGDIAMLSHACAKADIVLTKFKLSKEQKLTCDAQVFDRYAWRFDSARSFRLIDNSWQINKKRPEERLWMK